MKEVIIKILLIAIALSAITFFVASQTGLWGDSKTIRDRSHSRVSDSLAPPP
ncbi:hypothetical protein [Paenibacillus abyssi]|uniref:Uncharacterized protein n=1 Tax=Paenibacillus abyssi TaxID=1340531 RepID=A0A917G2E4_9BACL|nr:hypothetical protein [Paenibacillus abyssi]GGG18798.1 hypothetical protein GCM10010916_39510 [Paenibacillus abyssi]